MSHIPVATANSSSVLHCPPSSLVNGTRIPLQRWGLSRLSKPRCALLTTCSLKARWQIDARFGRKAEVAKLLQEWVRDIGSEAGLTNANAALSSGAVGAPESRLILEVDMDDMASLEAFWSNIPLQQHEAWCRTIQDMIVDGTPIWEVFRTIPIYADVKDAVTSSDVGLTIIDDMDEAAEIIGQVAMQPGSGSTDDFASNLKTSASGLSIVDNLEDVDRILGTGSSDVNVPSEESTVNKPKPGTSKFPLDWKGEPMKINPGDKFPRFQ